jgi:multiple sugar transport system permease protein
MKRNEVGFMKNYTFRELKDVFLFLLPLLLFIVALILIPVLGTIISSAFKDIVFLDNEFTGFGNYVWMAQNPQFLQSLRFTFLFVLVSVPLEMLLGLVFALLLNEPSPFRALLRVCVLIPWAVPAAISARMWELIYNYSFGLANFLCMRSGICDEPVNWLGAEASAFAALVVADAWKTTPFVAVIILTGLSAIPGDLHLQAQIDGANFIQRFFKITLPLLKSALVVALIFRTIDALRVFDVIYVLTGGGPGGATTSLSLHGYKYFLIGDFGYGSAVSVILFLIAFLLSIAYIRVGKFGKEVQ